MFLNKKKPKNNFRFFSFYLPQSFLLKNFLPTKRKINRNITVTINLIII